MAGTFRQHSAPEPGGMTCPTLFDQTITIDPEAVAPGTHEAGRPDGGTDCSWFADPSTCSLTTNCTIDADGYVSSAYGTVTFVNGVGTGKETVRIADTSGDVLASCTYDITMTPQ